MDEVIQALEGQVSAKAYARDLGVETQAGKRKRIGVSRARLDKAVRRARRVGILVGGQQAAIPLSRTMVTATAAYVVQARRMSQKALTTLRRAVANATVSGSEQRRCIQGGYSG